MLLLLVPLLLLLPLLLQLLTVLLQLLPTEGGGWQLGAGRWDLELELEIDRAPKHSDLKRTLLYTTNPTPPHPRNWQSLRGLTVNRELTIAARMNFIQEIG